MIEFQQGNSFFIFNTDQDFTEQQQFFDADYWQRQNRIIGSAKGRGITWFIRSADLFGVNTALRHYFRGGLFGKMVKDRYPFSDLNTTRSFAEFYLLNQLHQSGLPVPKPVGARVVKGKAGICYQADILTERVENAQDLTALLHRQTLPDVQWQAIGQVIRRLHDLQICHTDLNAHNILIQHNDDDEKIWLLDFDKCGQKSGNFWKAENLQRLHRSFVKEARRMGIAFSEKNWQDLLAGYRA